MQYRSFRILKTLHSKLLKVKMNFNFGFNSQKVDLVYKWMNALNFIISLALFRYEYSSSSQQQVNGNPTPTSNTQQSIKKNINDLDNLLSNLSSHNTSATIGGLSRASSKPASREGSPSRRGYTGHSSSHVSRQGPITCQKMCILFFDQIIADKYET